MLRTTWELKQQLDEGTNPPEVQAILEGVAPHLAGATLPGGIAANEAAAWTATVRVLLNLDEFLTRG